MSKKITTVTITAMLAVMVVIQLFSWKFTHSRMKITKDYVISASDIGFPTSNVSEIEDCKKKYDYYTELFMKKIPALGVLYSTYMLSYLVIYLDKTFLVNINLLGHTLLGYFHYQNLELKVKCLPCHTKEGRYLVVNEKGVYLNSFYIFEFLSNSIIILLYLVYLVYTIVNELRKRIQVPALVEVMTGLSKMRLLDYNHHITDYDNYQKQSLQ